ncbi:hypothetical protein QAO71_17855 (plasmid) [Halopseudomonas sp. SMJS2]|uniref:hypothetical protein n=1 Tax=Halopseudomonas sp. SMJS2 TaxID=3041098 RepID=UPI0024529F2D|nr:hypothetical protein [Halopseudomonas sp. SMJS2]WGK63407.1 hypothetical protein QAO71_17855 [Halopseudomonas sp. SMJS2]
MRKIALGTSAVAIVLGGCATPQPTTLTSYSYASEQHSGTVLVEETIAPSAFGCARDWREGKQYVPTGIHSMYPFKFEVQILAQGPGKDSDDISVSVPAHRANPVFAKDFQKSVTWMLGTESNGMISQGDLFYYPQGYFVRARDLSIKDNTLRLCLGVDRMYVPADTLGGTDEPLIRLDRLTIPFEGKSGETYRYTLQGAEPVTLTVKVDVK